MLTKYTSLVDALKATKSLLLEKKFIAAEMGKSGFTATRTTGAKADYFVADVEGTEDGGKIKIKITFVKVGTGLLNLKKVADEVKAKLQDKKHFKIWFETSDFSASNGYLNHHKQSTNEIYFIFFCPSFTINRPLSDYKTTEPEFSGVIVNADSSTSGKPLETATLAIKTKGNASLYITGIGKAISYGVVKGKTSSVVIPPSKMLYFVYKAESNTVNPKDVIQLVRFTTGKDGNRIMPIASATTFSASSNEVGYLEFTAKKYGKSSYLVSVSDLSPGEYGFSLGKESSYTVHMFTVK